MAAIILDGVAVANQIKAEVAEQMRRLERANVFPGVATILVGENPASETYVRNKLRACREIGIHAEKITPPTAATTEEIIELICRLNRRDDIDGVVLELPLPSHIDAQQARMAIDPAKDVDGFHPVNLGRIAAKKPGMVPCTPAGVVELLRRNHIAIEGAEAVIVGRSNIVGRPMAMLLTNFNATTTLCHSKTRDLAGICRRADILVAAMGRPALIRREFIKPGATVIDVGINHVEDRATIEQLFPGDEHRLAEFARKGYAIVGDVHPEVAEVAGAITPVPGGVGPLTVAMLTVNVVTAARLIRGLRAGVLAERVC